MSFRTTCRCFYRSDDSVLFRYYVATVDNLHDEPSVAREADLEDGAAAEDDADSETAAAVELLWSYVRSSDYPLYLNFSSHMQRAPFYTLSPASSSVHVCASVEYIPVT